ncbi:MAG TPA: ATPase domain-containing protein, partial [Thermoanaerobaculia bacterium]|jgi:circadian clock protein KaiC
VDFLKSRQVTALFTSLVSNSGAENETELGVSSLMDTWLSLRNLESNGERNRGLYVLKSRGMSHSNQIREFVLTDQGVELVNVYLGAEGVLTGSARLNQEARERAESAARQDEVEARRRRLARRRIALEAQIASLRAELEGDEEDLEKQAQETTSREDELRTNREAMASARHADTGGTLKERPSIEKRLERGIPGGSDATTSRRQSS